METRHFNVHSFLNSNDFDSNEACSRYPNAKIFFTGSIFICHAGIDSHKINDDINLPVIYDRFADGCFFHNRGTGGSKHYKELVRVALRLCDKFLLVVSKNSVNHEWVKAEVAWAVDNNRSIIMCLFDDSAPTQIHFKLSVAQLNNRLYTVDFSNNIKHAQTELSIILDKLLKEIPYQRLQNGSPLLS